MFLDGYKRNWLHTEGLAFEDRMIDDLSVSTILSHSILSDERFPACLFCVFAAALYRRRWRKRRRKKRRKRRSPILFISSSFTSAAPLSQRKGERDEVLPTRRCLSLMNILHCFIYPNEGSPVTSVSSQQTRYRLFVHGVC